jgi:hypothetical protein
MSNYPEVNGSEVSYCSIELDLDGTKMPGVTKIDYGEETEFGKVKGTSPKNVGRTRGNSDFTGEIEMTHRQWQEILPKLTRNGKVGFSESSWPVSVSYSEPSDASLTMTDKLIGVRFHSPKRAEAEGVDVSKVTVSMDIMDLAWNSRYVGIRRRR